MLDKRVMLQIYDFVDSGVAFGLRRVNSISAMFGFAVLMMMSIIQPPNDMIVYTNVFHVNVI
jgi:hypothetical protein